MNKVRASSVSLALMGGSVYAAVPADVTTAISDMKADGITVATAVLVAVIALFAIKFIKKGIGG